MERFADDRQRDAHGAFVRWQVRNPCGYVLNLSSPSSATMHRALCSHVADYSDEEASLTTKPKLCSIATQGWLRYLALVRGKLDAMDRPPSILD